MSHWPALSGSTWPRGGSLAPTGETLIVLIVGQSNCEGRDPTLIQPASNLNAQKLEMDGALYPYAEPGISDTNSVYPAVSHVSAQTMGASFIDRMRALGYSKRILIVNSPKSGSLSQQWADSVPLGDNPTNILGVARLRARAALTYYPGARCITVIYQGESDAILVGDASAHQANWTTVLASWRPFLTSLGGAQAAKNTYNMRLPATPSSTGTFWTTVDAQKVSHAAADSAMRLPQCADGPWFGSGNLHLDRVGQAGNGLALANSVILDM